MRLPAPVRRWGRPWEWAERWASDPPSVSVLGLTSVLEWEPVAAAAG